jgi:hypothetical protein
MGRGKGQIYRRVYTSEEEKGRFMEGNREGNWAGI